jgi:sec-independent protein translocase protein TatB
VSLGPGEVLIVLVVALIVLGPDKLPQAARNIAKAYREVRTFSNSVRSQVEDALELDDSRPPRRPDGPSTTTPVNPPNPDLSGFTLVDSPPPEPAAPEPARGAPLFQRDTNAPPVEARVESDEGEK